MTADITIEATPGQIAAVERDGFLVVVGPTMDCPTCQGAGRWSDGLPCTACRGIRASIENGYRNIDGWSRVPVPTTKPCPECGGKGTARYPIDNFAPVRCNECNGDGTVPITVEVVVPPRGHCPAGWAATTEDVCNCTGGHYCVRPRGHDSKQHRCACGVTTTRQDALPSPDEEGPARTLLRGTAEAVPVYESSKNIAGHGGVHTSDSDYIEVLPSGTVLLVPFEGRHHLAGLGGRKGARLFGLPFDITDHFADVPRPEVGDTAWIIRGEG